MKQYLNIKKVAHHMTTSFSFNELEKMIHRGVSVADLILVVPAGVIHSGTIWTSYGHIVVMTNKTVKKAILTIKAEAKNITSADYM